MSGDHKREDVLVINMFRVLLARIAVLATDESGMSTVEYAIGTIAAAAFGAILYTVVTGDSIVSALTNIIGRALNTKV
jgi:O-acetylhomoserine/O-acetylserine sulfhydrylase-like pyridoxal-dependent enzyme